MAQPLDVLRVPTCPHCGHELEEDEMFSASRDDLYQVAVEAQTATVTCPMCDRDYLVKGGSQIFFTSAFVEEQLQEGFQFDEVDGGATAEGGE